jgi:hypothetical protein
MMNAEGRLCVRFYKRSDGTVITQDCPVGWAKIKQKTKVVVTAAFSMLMAMLSGVFLVSLVSKQRSTVGELRIPFVTPTPVTTMGAVAYRPDVGVIGKVSQPIMGNVAIKGNERIKRPNS